jgi:hypothetical protein
MPDGGDLSSLRDRLTKLEFESSQRPTKEFVQSEDEKVLSKAAANDRERNEVLLKLIDERLGAHRSAILTDMERDHQRFRTELTEGLESLLTRRLPSAVKSEMDKLEAEKALEEQKEQAEREAKLQRYKNRVAFIGSCVVLLTALVTFYFSLRGDTGTTEVRHLDSVGSALSDFR